jgi:hypothetical protein
LNDLVGKMKCRAVQGLSHILILKLREFLFSLGAIGVKRLNFQYPPYGQSYATEAGLAVKLFRVGGDSISGDHDGSVGRFS